MERSPAIRPAALLFAFALCAVAGLLGLLLWSAWVTAVLGLAGTALFAAIAVRLMALAADDAAPAVTVVDNTDGPHRPATSDQLTRATDRTGLVDWFDRIDAPDGTIVMWRGDLDHFGRVNAAVGHDLGDAVLQESADRLRNALTSMPELDGVVAHIGGDEFVVAVIGASDGAIDALSAKLAAAHDEPFIGHDPELTVTMSFGRCTGAAGQTSLAELLVDADLALTQAKQRGRHRIEHHDAPLREQAVTRAALGAEIRGAVERDEFELYHQPIVELATGRIVAAECLLRWNHPDRGVLTPGDFLDVADESGVLADIGQHTIRSTCRRFATLNRSAPWPLRASLNLSARELLIPGLPRTVRTALAASGLAPALLMIEISEASVIDDQVRDRLAELRDLGIGVALDDLGTASTPLAGLATLPITAVKVDRRFVETIGNDTAGDALAAAVIDLGRAFGHEVIAEGVTTEQQAEWLRARGCWAGQGWLYGRPTSFSRLAKLIASLPSPSEREDHTSSV